MLTIVFSTSASILFPIKGHALWQRGRNTEEQQILGRRKRKHSLFPVPTQENSQDSATYSQQPGSLSDGQDSANYCIHLGDKLLLKVSPAVLGSALDSVWIDDVAPYVALRMAPRLRSRRRSWRHLLGTLPYPSITFTRGVAKTHGHNIILKQTILFRKGSLLDIALSNPYLVESI